MQGVGLVASVTCVVCAVAFEAKSRVAKYCSSQCSYRARMERDGGRCSVCGKHVWRNATSAEVIRCRDCINGGRGYFVTADGGRYSHGQSGYRRGCRCQVCRDGHSERMAVFHERFKEKHGRSQGAVWHSEFHAKNGYWRNGSGWGFVSTAVRLSIYERDGWVCQICFEPVDRDADVQGDLFPSLDHIVPQSRSAVPDHSVENLRTAHRICNIRRGAALDEVEVS